MVYKIKWTIRSWQDSKLGMRNVWRFNTSLVKDIIENKKITTEWGEPSTHVEYEFKALTADTTYVIIKNWGFKDRGAELIKAINDNTGGFTTVLDGLKAYLEHNIKLNLISDKFPHIKQK